MKRKISLLTYVLLKSLLILLVIVDTAFLFISEYLQYLSKRQQPTVTACVPTGTLCQCVYAATCIWSFL